MNLCQIWVMGEGAWEVWLVNNKVATIISPKLRAARVGTRIVAPGKVNVFLSNVEHPLEQRC